MKGRAEKERLAYVDAQMERRFKDNTDELRKVAGDFKERKTVYDRNI